MAIETRESRAIQKPVDTQPPRDHCHHHQSIQRRTRHTNARVNPGDPLIPLRRRFDLQIIAGAKHQMVATSRISR